ncbi:MAG TPA: Pr6Pr family membrane protein [Mucilaginibacter sp.]|jgi:hypothetical protein
MKIAANKALLAITAITAIFAVISQLYLALVHSQTSVFEAIINFFSYFTIENNFLVAACSIVVLLAPASSWGRFFSRPTTLSAITVYIFIVGLVYNLVLRSIWNPTGFPRVVDELLHVVVPLLFLFYWIFFVPKANLNWNISWWLIFPTVYAIYTFTRGAVTNWYPYPFLDMNKLGTQQVILNTCGLVAVFLIFSLLFIAVGKLLSRAASPKPFPKERT